MDDREQLPSDPAGGDPAAGGEAAPTWNAASEPPAAPTPWGEPVSAYADADETEPLEPLQPLGAGGSAWGAPPPTGYGSPTGPAGWGAPPAPTRSSARPLLVVLAIVMLVLASAGVGAGAAIALHSGNSSSRVATPTPNPLPNFGGNDNGGNVGGNNGGDIFGNGNGNNGSNNGSSGSIDLQAIAQKVRPAMVNINTTLGDTGKAAGSGMLISSTGDILTNNHVIADATSIKVTVGGVGNAYDAKVVGYDVADDVALIKITDNVNNLPTVVFGDPSNAHIGDEVAAIGNALGKGGPPSVSQGRVTALDQQITAGDPGGKTETLHGMIQIDAPIQPGDSGGALLDSDGRVIGMNTAAAGGRFQVEGSNIGFAIPIDNAVGIVRQIQSGDEKDGVHIGARALLGVQVRDAGTTDPFGDSSGDVAPVNSGALVIGVQDGTGADTAGIRPGDVVVAVNDTTINSSDGLHTALQGYHPGDSVKIGWVDRSGTRHDAQVALVEGPPA